MAKRGCVVEPCDEPKDKDRKSQFCSEHFAAWMRSPEFRASTQDADVRFLMGLGLTKEAMRIVNKYGRKFAKRIASADEQVEP